MPIIIAKNDITKLKTDAIVNSTNHFMYGFSGVDELIHEIGGEAFEEECDKLIGECLPGEAVYTNAYNLPCRYIIHTIGPSWNGGIDGEAAIVRSCYRSSLVLAEELGCKRVAFPLISAGTRGFPVVLAFKNAITAVREFLDLNDDSMEVYIVLFGSVYEEIMKEQIPELTKLLNGPLDKTKEKTLDEILKSVDKSFAEMLNDFLIEKDMTDPQCYHAAGITKQTFNKLRNGKTGKPSLKTAVAISMALKLNIDETERFLASAGLVLSGSSESDIIIRYFIEHEKYDIYELDVQLVNHGQEAIIEL